jgi:hypothetical protein
VAAAGSDAVVELDPFAGVAGLPGLDDAVAAARAAVDALLRHRILRRRSSEVTAEATLRSARASAALEGHGMSLETLRAHLGRAAEADSQAGGGGGGGGREAGGGAVGGDPVPFGVLRLYAELGGLAQVWERAPSQALARMHVLAARGIVSDGDLGRPGRPGDAVRDEASGLGLGPAPAPAERAARLDMLTSLLVRPTSASALVVAAVVHGELLALRPFGSLDGVVARAAARLVLIGRGLDPKAVTATDVGHLEAGADEAGAPGVADAGAGGVGYAEAARGYAAGGTDGVRRWVAHCCRAVELGARESSAICESLARASG